MLARIWPDDISFLDRFEFRMNDSDVNSAGPSTEPSGFPIGRMVFLVALVLGGVYLVRSSLPSRAPTQASRAIGKPAPEVELVRLESGEPVQATTGSGVTLLHFWGTWCGPCRMEYPHLAATANELTKESPEFEFLPVSCESGPGETIEGLLAKTTEYFGRESITSPALADPRGTTRRSAAERLEQPSLYYPTSFLIGPDGKIAGVWEGYTPEAVDEMAAMSRSLMAAGS